MRELPVLFNGEMVRAILDGRKTNTMRPVKPQPEAPSMPLRDFTVDPVPVERNGTWAWRWEQDYPDGWDMAHTPFRSPLGSTGDRLYVRETLGSGWTYGGAERCLWYKADGASVFSNGDWSGIYDGPRVVGSIWDVAGVPKTVTWRPSIHMPKRAARIWLEVLDVKVMRVQDVTEEQARAEGIIDGGCMNCGEPEPCGCPDPRPDARDAFAHLWMSIYGDESWHRNDWCWSYSFRVLSTTGRPA